MSGFGLGPLPRTYDAAMRDARDKKAIVRLSAVRDLARHATGVTGGRAVGALLEVLARDTSAEVRGAAAVALADSASRDAVSGLLEATEDASDHVRQMALLALGEVSDQGDARVLGAVERALESDRAPLRFQALIAINRLNGEPARAAILRAAGDSDAEVRHLALRILEERATDASGVVELAPDVSKAARDALDDASPRVKLAAAILLARSGDRAGTDVIADSLNRTRADLDEEDLGTAMTLAADLGLSEARPGLSRRAWGGLIVRDPLAFEARIALARMGDPRARAAIVKGLSSWSRDTRTMAVVAAGRAGIVEARARISEMHRNPRLAEPDAVVDALSRLGAAADAEPTAESGAAAAPKDDRP